MGDYSVRVAELSDLSAILGVQRRAFGRVALELGIDPQQMPPLTETLADLKRLHSGGCRFMVAEAEGIVVGSVRAQDEDGVIEVGRLVVDDGWERRGVASALMCALEASYEAPTEFRLFTGEDAVGPLRFYENRGYVRIGAEDVLGVRIVWLRKPGPNALS